jgi:hypothetical protein
MKMIVPKPRKVVPTAPVRAYAEFRILVCGSRDWADIDTINTQLCKLILEKGMRYKDVLVITGSTIEDDNGADSLVASLCKNELGIACAVFSAAWPFHERLGNKRAAGPIRNGWMLRWGRPDYVLAFHPYLPGSRGTKNMLKQAHDLGIPSRLIEKENT